MGGDVPGALDAIKRAMGSDLRNGEYLRTLEVVHGFATLPRGISS